MYSTDFSIHRTARWRILAAFACLGACQPTPVPGALAPGALNPGLDPDQRALAAWGKVLFEKRWLESEGLGLYYNFAACSDCHALPAAGGHGDKKHLARNTVIAGDMTGLPFQAIRGRAPQQLPTERQQGLVRWLKTL
jgi:hypothetical protein